MIFDAQGNELAPTENLNEGFEHIPSFNFSPPTPKPAWFDQRLIDIGGKVPGTELPCYRVVWGMDEKQFAMGKMRLKYVTIIDIIQTTVGYNIVNLKKKKGNRFMKPEAAHRFYGKNLDKNLNTDELIVPVINEEEREIGLPLWVAEYYMKPEGFGSKEDWERNRWMTNPENPLQRIDVLGEYPSRGAYFHWFDIVGYDDEGKETYKELDESVVEMFRANHAFNIARRKRLQYDTTEIVKKRKLDKYDEDWNKFGDDIAHGILDVKKNRKFNTPGISNPGKG